MKYRPDIDGLRAIAVLAVIAFHAFPESVRGGFVGVDIFFVISGFLISGIIFSALDRGRFSFSDFYARRIRRIFPALVIVLASAYAAGWFLLYADRFAEMGKQIAGGAGFVANYVLLRESGYFDGASDTKPFLHLWSLGVEEQFYLLWPLLAWLAWKRRFDLLGVTLAILLGSLYLNLDRIRRDLIGTFFLPQTRFWELMAGAVLAHVSSCEPHWGPLVAGRRWYLRMTSQPQWRAALSTVGALLIVGSIFGIDRARDFPGRWAILPVAGATFLIAAGPEAWFNRRILSLPAVVGVGLISYPLYLWHWPMLTLLRLLNGETPPAPVRALAVAASAFLAWLTYRFIERPIRFGPPRPWIVTLLCVSLAGIGVAGYATYQADGLWSRAINRSDKAPFAAYYDAMRKKGVAAPYRLECDFMQLVTDTVKDHIAPECTAPGRDQTWFLWGDSHAQALSAGLTHLLPDGVALAQVATSSCRPSFSPIDVEVPGGRCARANGFAAERIRALKPAVLIVAQQSHHELTDWEALAAEARRLGAQRVVVVGPVPSWTPSLPEIVITRYWGSNFDRIGYGLVADRKDEDDRLRARYSRSALLTYVSLISQLCNADGCVATVPGARPVELMAFDGSHLTPLGSRYVADLALRPVLLPK
jgi:peptidoglycan/LPS O-acetylase OafA/YrhL